MRILVLADVESKYLWDYFEKEKLDGIDLILSCGDLKPQYLSFLASFSKVPILYVHGNHDDCYEIAPPDGCICIENKIYVYRGVRIMGLGGSIRYNNGKNQYTQAQMKQRVRKMWLSIKRHKGIDISRQYGKSVAGAHRCYIGKFINTASAAEAEILKYREGRVNRQAVYIHDSRLLYNMVGIILLVYGHGNAVRGVCYLRHGVYDKPVILFAVVGGDDIKPVSDIEERGRVILFGGVSAQGDIVAAQLLGKRFKLAAAFGGKRGFKMNGRIGKGDPLTSLKHRAHGFCRHRRPASVFNEPYRASAEAALGKMLNKFAHIRENSGVVRGRGKHQLAEAEGIRHGA